MEGTSGTEIHAQLTTVAAVDLSVTVGHMMTIFQPVFLAEYSAARNVYCVLSDAHYHQL